MHAVALFLSAFLLFLVEPLVGKRLLPWFGGAPAVWTTCLFFFQMLLLAGYGFAHLVTRLRPRAQVIAYVALLAATALQVPIAIGDSWKPTSAGDPVVRILEVLLLTIGMPYLLLAATTPLMQRWASRDRRVAAPYTLYAVSNAGALLALLVYPFAVEPRLAVNTQMTVWSGAFGVFAVIAAALAFSHRHGSATTDVQPVEPATEPQPVRTQDRVVWTALAACASGLLAATTAEMCQDIASVPFLWVLPLGLYLLTFVLAFAGIYHRIVVAIFFTAAAAAACFVTLRGPGAPIEWQVAAASSALFFGAWLCHGELVRRTPDASHLTEFYLVVATGGAAGTLVSLGAPLVFRGFWEFPLFLFLTTVMFLAATMSGVATRTERWVANGSVLMAPVMVIALLVWPGPSQGEIPIASVRNFYGVLQVADDLPTEVPRLRRLRNGRILHGVQFLDPARRMQPSSYYSRRSGIDRGMRAIPKRMAGEPLRIAVIGLGTGSMAAWGQAGDHMAFYEINPQVIDVANQYFTYLKDTPATVEVIPGDARLSLEQPRRDDERFDVMVLDAFSGDAIPVHLLTREASDTYWKALRDDGVLAIHVTNRHLDLTPVVRGMAQVAGKEAVYAASGNNLAAAVFRSNWILLSSDRDVLAGLAGVGQQLDDENGGTPTVWTDNFSNLFEVLHKVEE